MEKLESAQFTWAALKPALLRMAKSELTLRESVEMFSKAYVAAALELSKGNQVRASRMIGTHRNTVARWSHHK